MPNSLGLTDINNLYDVAVLLNGFTEGWLWSALSFPLFFLVFNFFQSRDIVDNLLISFLITSGYCIILSFVNIVNLLVFGLWFGFFIFTLIARFVKR